MAQYRLGYHQSTKRNRYPGEIWRWPVGNKLCCVLQYEQYQIYSVQGRTRSKGDKELFCKQHTPLKNTVIIHKVIPKMSHFTLQIFIGNIERNFVVTHRFLRPFKARYVRVHPKTWRSHISMRVELYGCRLGKTFKRNSADNALKINFTREEFLETNELPSAQHFNVNITSGIWLSSRKRKEL